MPSGRTPERARVECLTRLDEEHRMLLEEAVDQWIAQRALAQAAEPGPWQRAALRDGVERRAWRR